MFYTPEQVAERYPQIVARTVQEPPAAAFAKGAIAGVFIALAVYGAHSISALLQDAGIAALIASLLFPCGLAMVLLVGGELFTGNCVMAIAIRRNGVSAGRVLRNWLIVYLGNFAGSLFIAAMVAYARQGDMAYVQAAVRIAEGKAALTIPGAFVRAVLCNICVCSAVWMSHSSESAAGRIVAIYFPVMLFVLTGSEHCVANMMTFPVALWLGGSPALSWPGFLLRNLLPVTLGNMAGGTLVFGALLTLSFHRELRPRPEKKGTP